MIKADVVVDAKGLACPMPIVRAKKAMDTIMSGQVVEILSTDRGSVNDFTAWVKQMKHELLRHEEDNGVFKFYVRKS